MRGGRPFVFTGIRDGRGVDDVVAWIRRNVLLEDVLTCVRAELGL